MQYNIKPTNIKYHLHYYFSDMVSVLTNIKNFDSSLLEINKLSFKGFSVNIYYIKCMTLKSLDHANIDNENVLYLVFNNVDEYIKEENVIK